MREFETEGKINFVDQNDVLVGFDNYQSCCENFGWFYSSIQPTDASCISQKSEVPADLESYNFDPQFFQSLGKDESEVAVFKLICGDKSLYLGLFNSHNGYYSHGFQVEVNGEVIRKACL